VQPGDPSPVAVFVGSTPCGKPIRTLLRIPQEARADVIQWKLSLYEDDETHAPKRYALQCEYGPAAAGSPGIDKPTRLRREGEWVLGRGTKSDAAAAVYEFREPRGGGSIALVKVNDHLLHVLSAERSLLNGEAGWSYTLNREDVAEARGDLALALRRPSMSFRISPPASGESVFGVFEGRTPCHGIARVLKVPEAKDAGCLKVKWRVTLYQDPHSGSPTTYKVEGSLHRGAARQGKWTIVRGTALDPRATVYRLEPANGEAALNLRRGDENVLFFLDETDRPLVGSADFSYTLNRRLPNP
jgi:hypothetical protein